MIWSRFLSVATNTGNGPASGISVVIDGIPANRVIIRDSIPINTTFASFGSILGGTALYHRTGDAQHVYTSPASSPGAVDAVAARIFP